MKCSIEVEVITPCNYSLEQKLEEIAQTLSNMREKYPYVFDDDIEIKISAKLKP